MSIKANIIGIINASLNFIINALSIICSVHFFKCCYLLIFDDEYLLS